MNKLQQSEAINLQASIIAWLQQQVIKPTFNLTEVKELIEVLYEAVKSYEILLALEERRLSQTLISPAPLPLEIENKPRQRRKTKDIPLPPTEEEEPTNRQYFSLEEAHADAVRAGYDKSASVFRRDLTLGHKIFGWRKANRSGNKPSYYKEE
ncbi:MAG: hypothetical protein RMK91_01620 [Pseudanabaenaceae cyanobacterium SKYGB_i_bin29]|nr:hypothetical protein [Pseudanabaenaceae cyanobacterium SKYG29]MDW8420547.1 hypothetical protein [Pseudanabaenaceae cyanobacterium SKYGB_i_bin29]